MCFAAHQIPNRSKCNEPPDTYQGARHKFASASQIYASPLVMSMYLATAATPQACWWVTCTYSLFINFIQKIPIDKQTTRSLVPGMIRIAFVLSIRNDGKVKPDARRQETFVLWLSVCCLFPFHSVWRMGLRGYLQQHKKNRRFHLSEIYGLSMIWSPQNSIGLRNHCSIAAEWRKAGYIPIGVNEWIDG